MGSRIVKSSCMAVSWIPQEAIQGLMRVPMDIGIGHYDDPPPQHMDDIEAFVAGGGCRFANRLEAWVEIDDGKIVTGGCSGGGLVAGTQMGIGKAHLTVAAIGFPELRSSELDDDQSTTFVQTAGGRTGAPYPRRVEGARVMKLTAPTAWSTLALTINADGTSSFAPRGASQFPRHWFYDHNGDLVSKSGTIDYDAWVSADHNHDTPWGNTEHEVHLAACASALELELSRFVMDDASPDIRTIPEGEVLMAQGEQATRMVLILDGFVDIDIDGEVVAESGPGTVIGERSVLQGGRRTATVTATTPVKVAEIDCTEIDLRAREQLQQQHTT